MSSHAPAKRGADDFRDLLAPGAIRAYRIGGDAVDRPRDRRPRAEREQLVARADAGLYEVKRRRRDGVLLAPQATTSA